MGITLGQDPGGFTRDSGTIGYEGSPGIPFLQDQGNGIRQSVKSRLAPDFVCHFKGLPARVQRVARKNYKLWKEDPPIPVYSSSSLEKGHSGIAVVAEPYFSPRSTRPILQAFCKCLFRRFSWPDREWISSDPSWDRTASCSLPREQGR